MKSRRPYLIRALYQWIVDSDTTPFILVKVNGPEVVVPAEYVTDGQITLNIAPTAVRDLVIDDQLMNFAGRFAGRAFQVSLPLTAIGAIYARETGDGMLFETESRESRESREAGASTDAGGANEPGAGEAKHSGAAPTVTLEAVEQAEEAASADSARERTPRSAPHLKLIKK